MPKHSRKRKIFLPTTRRATLLLCVLAGLLVVGVGILQVRSERQQKTANTTKQLQAELARLGLPLQGSYYDGSIGAGFCDRSCTKLDRVYNGSQKLDSVRDRVQQSLTQHGYTNLQDLQQVISAQRGGYSIAIYSEKASPSHTIDVYLSLLN